MRQILVRIRNTEERETTIKIISEELIKIF